MSSVMELDSDSQDNIKPLKKYKGCRSLPRITSKDNMDLDVRNISRFESRLESSSSTEDSDNSDFMCKNILNKHPVSYKNRMDKKSKKKLSGKLKSFKRYVQSLGKGVSKDCSEYRTIAFI